MRRPDLLTRLWCCRHRTFLTARPNPNSATRRYHSTNADTTTATATAAKQQNNVDDVHADLNQRPATRTQHATRTITDEYAVIKEKYATPRHPIVLAHGLLGFDELRLLGRALPGIQYWRGIREALEASGCEVITAAVGPTDSIERRAEALARQIAARARGRPVNVVAHSMGGLDARYMISRLMRRPASKGPGEKRVGTETGTETEMETETVEGNRAEGEAAGSIDGSVEQGFDIDVRSLTTIATPHRGSAFADFVSERVLGPARLAAALRAMEALGVPSGAWTQLTRAYMADTFNSATPDVRGVRYFSYGAQKRPSVWSAFWLSERVVRRAEGANDGLVSVRSSRWGDYKGTLDDVSHLDLINWTNRLKWILWQLGGMRRKFNAVALYLSIADMLAKEGL